MFGIRPSRENGEGMWDQGCLPFDRKIRLGCPKHNSKRFISLPQKCHISYGLNPKKGRICVAWVWSREGTEKLVNGKQHSVWFVPTGMNGLPQNVLLNFRLEFPKSDLTNYLPSGISEIFFQMVSTPVPTFQTLFQQPWPRIQRAEIGVTKPQEMIHNEARWWWDRSRKAGPRDWKFEALAP